MYLLENAVSPGSGYVKCKKGQIVTVIRENGNMTHVCDDGGMQFWVKTNLLTKEKPVVIEGEVIEEPAPAVKETRRGSRPVKKQAPPPIKGLFD